VQNAGDLYPFTLLEGVLDEPLLLSKDKQGTARCLSNVCTHRGKIIVESAGNKRMLSCGYHGRCFHLDGRYKSMPAFEAVDDFPTKADDLTNISLKEWLGMYFVSLDPQVSFEEMIAPINERVSFLPLDTMRYDAENSTDYYMDANWVLYCDNYLEGFHIPFVHPALNDALDLEEYAYEIFDYCNLQVGVGDGGEPCFDLPEGHVDYGKNIYAWYFWLYPNLMLNFYPWGLSLNVVTPLGHNRTKVSFRSYVFENSEFDTNEQRLHETEMEDEEVVLSVQKGVQSRFYKAGRFSPTMEQGVHHFHQLIQSSLEG